MANIIELLLLLNWCTLSVALDNGQITQMDFCYEDETCGPESEDWKGQCKTGSLQSPINLPFVTHRHSRRVELEFNDFYCNDGRFE